MKEERLKEILSKVKKTVGENNYKLALAITGHRPGKIRDVSMSSKDGELLLEYIEQLETNWNELKKWLEEKLPTNKDIITKSVKLIEIYNKMQELESGNNE